MPHSMTEIKPAEFDFCHNGVLDATVPPRRRARRQRKEERNRPLPVPIDDGRPRREERPRMHEAHQAEEEETQTCLISFIKSYSVFPRSTPLF